uniref:Valine--tRNA ligase n=1 Tax=candidate division WOR-3 bacterium TaxID=2052148 RepID=A0A7C4XJS7_UNCW3
MEEISSRYDPRGIEDKWYEFWMRERLFTPDLNSNKPTYTIVIPPPNVTGRLHLGHFLNNTVQDILIRYKKMSGFETLWVPGMDHAGIATQVVVEERLLKSGIKREDLGREKFIEEVWKWKEEYAEAIRTQLKKMGCSLDWTREQFTLSEDYSRKVIKVFVDLYKKGLIYPGKRIINWCPRCLTALSDEQVETVNKNGKLYYIKYPLKDKSNFITVATTRPETMLGDTAVCVNPDDGRYKEFIGKTVILPLMEREIPIIADSYVDPEFGTGALKVTPAHDPFDFELAKKYNLEIIEIMNPDATLNENAKDYKNIERFEARKKIVNRLREIELLEKIEDYTVPLGICERCDTPIEPRLSKQWFVRMKPLAEPALKVVEEGRIKIFPKRWVNLYNHWLENVKDWCISRQIWWGHRIPIYYCLNCYKPDKEETQKGIIVSERMPEVCPECGSKEIYQDEDVLDTWFSSWLWPFATLGWPEESADYKHFYPTQTLATGWDIIYLWVARMIMAGLEFTKNVPFSSVVFHPMIRDEKGRKMSKSLGNSPEIMDLIEKYGCDAMRLGILLITPREQDVLFSEKSLDVGRKFCNKLWNASRLILTNFKDERYEKIDTLTPFDRWIFNEFNNLLTQIDYYFQNFELNAIARRLYDFFWHKFCDWYLEFIKVSPYSESNISKFLLKKILIVFHPFIPFITEEIYQRFTTKKKSILLEEWPVIEHPVSYPEVDTLIGLITEIRNMRGILGINPKHNLPLILKTDAQKEKFVKGNFAILNKLAGVDSVASGERPKESAVTLVLPEMVCYVVLKGVDVKRERMRLEEEIKFLNNRIDEIRNRLNDPDFLNKSSAEIKEREKAKLEEFLKKREHIQRAMEGL